MSSNHDWNMPHDVRFTSDEMSVEGCPPNCPARSAYAQLPDGIREAVAEAILATRPGFARSPSVWMSTLDKADAAISALLTELERIKWVPSYLQDELDDLRDIKHRWDILFDKVVDPDYVFIKRGSVPSWFEEVEVHARYGGTLEVYGDEGLTDQTDQCVTLYRPVPEQPDDGSAEDSSGAAW